MSNADRTRKMDYFSFLQALRQLKAEGDERARATRASETGSTSPPAGRAEELHAQATRFLQTHEVEKAAACWEEALACDPRSAELLWEIGAGLRMIGRDPVLIAPRIPPPEDQALPDHSTWLRTRNAILAEDWEGALPDLEAEHDRNGRSLRAARNLAFALRRVGRDGLAQCVLGTAHMHRQEWRLAANAFAAVAEDDADARPFLSARMFALRYIGEDRLAIELASSANARGDCSPTAFLQWADALTDMGRAPEAIALLRDAASASGDPLLRFRAETLLPSVPASPDALIDAHARVRRFVDALSAWPMPDDPAQLAALEAALEPNFLLGYQGDSDGHCERRLGAFAARVMSRRFPDTRNRNVTSFAGDRRIRVGYVIRQVGAHTITRHFAGWIAHADQTRFELHLFPLESDPAWMGGYLQGHVDVAHRPSEDVTALVDEISAAGIDVLVYPAIGMDEISYRLAALRLAPVQCVAWGHPVSTGLPTIDYFLSAESMEPANAQAHYSERLVTLPGNGVCLPEPALAVPSLRRDDFGIPEGRSLYLSPQSLFKYLPDHDDIYARIAEIDADALFAFSEGQYPVNTRTFRMRLEGEFRRRGLDPDFHVKFLPRLEFTQFLALLKTGDAMLDTIGWSGGQTSYDAIACGLPVVTLPGEAMRGRQTCGMLRTLGIEDTIATDRDDYVRIAARLGQDRAWRDDVASRIRERRHLLFNDTRCVKSLEAFYRWAVGAAQPGDAAMFKLWPREEEPALS